jgi:hypothetical protein
VFALNFAHNRGVFVHGLQAEAKELAETQEQAEAEELAEKKVCVLLSP